MEENDVLEVGLPSVFVCGQCEETVTNRVLVRLKVILSLDGELIGIDAAAKNPLCGHEMRRVRFDPRQVALALDSGVGMLYADVMDEDDP